VHATLGLDRKALSALLALPDKQNVLLQWPRKKKNILSIATCSSLGFYLSSEDRLHDLLEEHAQNTADYLDDHTIKPASIVRQIANV